MNIPNGKFRSLHATLALTCLGVIVAQYPGYAQDAANSSSQSSVSRLFIYYEQTDTSNGPPGRPISDTNLVARLANTTWGGPSMPKVPGKQNWFTLNPDMTVRRGWSDTLAQWYVSGDRTIVVQFTKPLILTFNKHLTQGTDPKGRVFNPVNISTLLQNSLAENVQGSKWSLNATDLQIDPQKAWFIFGPNGAVKFGWGAVGSWEVMPDNSVTVILPKQKAPQDRLFKRHLTFNKHFSIATDGQGRQYNRIL